MANALTFLQPNTGAGRLPLHQALHGYAEGHRLLESSIPIPDDLKRPMLRMSDLSGTSVLSGFQDYLTGYPLPSLDAYALARTWYAPEMSRPGCVWTHTFIITASTMARIGSLSVIRPLFRRPDGRAIAEIYSKPIFLDTDSQQPQDFVGESEQQARIQALIAAHYDKESRPVVVPTSNSDEYADLIFALWSQKWPTLRMSFTFCTGSLSARTYENRPLDVQCVSVAAARQVSREIVEAGFGQPIVLDSAGSDPPRWSILAANDALLGEQGPVRGFLWSAADNDSPRAYFQPFLKIYHDLADSLPFSGILELTAELFPSPSDGKNLKRVLLGAQKTLSIPHLESETILLALATTEHHQSFDLDQLSLKEQASRLMSERPTAGRVLLRELFRASLNPIGDEILKALVVTMRPEDALEFAADQQQFLPALFGANPNLATAPELWRVAKDRQRELFESLPGQPSMEPELVRRIIDALLDSSSDGLIGRAFKQWGRVAILEALDWMESHGGSIKENSRTALTYYLPDVMAWVGPERNRSTAMLAALAHVVAPYASQIANNDSTVWLHTLRALHENRNDDANYVSAFVFALGLCNAPPAPLDLVSESFERVHRLAEIEQLRDDSWFILQPLVPQLSWGKNWDKCERMRRALMSAFMRYSWPASQLRERIKNPHLVGQLLKSARKVGADYYFHNV